MIQKIFNLVSILIIAALLIWIMTLKSCGPGGEAGDVIGRDTLTTIDTTLIVVHDTVWQKEYIRLHRDTISIPEIVYIRDTVIGQPLTGSGSAMRTSYKGEQKDTTLSIQYEAITDGELIELKLDYLLLQPRQTTTYVDRIIEKENTVIETRYVSGFYLGGGLGYSFALDRSSIPIGASLSTKKGTMYSYHYDLSLKSHSIGLKYRIFPLRRPE